MLKWQSMQSMTGNLVLYAHTIHLSSNPTQTATFTFTRTLTHTVPTLVLGRLCTEAKVRQQTYPS
eukprot:m.372944 g.372944  ORF g.372944 m.372944 type:complete len:65 (-) comp65114_c0_seq1:16-210(-)